MNYNVDTNRVFHKYTFGWLNVFYFVNLFMIQNEVLRFKWLDDARGYCSITSRCYGEFNVAPR